MQFYVSEDLAKASGPKVHRDDCRQFLRRKPAATTTRWHGPFVSYTTALAELDRVSKGHRQPANPDPRCCKPAVNHIRSSAQVSLLRAEVCGTPRGFGQSRTEDSWRACIARGQWSQRPGTPLQGPLHITMSFRVNAQSGQYGHNPEPNGTDLDNLVICTLSGLIPHAARPTAAVISSASEITTLQATKVLVEHDEDAGMDLVVCQAEDSVLPELLCWQPVFEFSVRRETGDLRADTRHAAREANSIGRHFSTQDRVGIAAIFSSRYKNNIGAQETLKAIIDGLGASQATSGRTFFHRAPGKGEYNSDDSIVFALDIRKVPEFPDGTVARVLVFDLAHATLAGASLVKR